MIAAARAAGGADVRATSPRCCAAPSQVMLPEHDVYITDWKNARDVPLADGRFGFDEFVDHLIRFLRRHGAGQPHRRGLPAGGGRAGRGGGDGGSRRSGAAAQHDADGGTDRHAGQSRPRSTNSPKSRPIEWFERHLISAVPWRYPGRVPSCLSGLRAALGVHEHEPGSAHQRAFRPVPQPGRRRRSQRRGASRSSTTSTAR